MSGAYAIDVTDVGSGFSRTARAHVGSGFRLHAKGYVGRAEAVPAYARSASARPRRSSESEVGAEAVGRTCRFVLACVAVASIAFAQDRGAQDSLGSVIPLWPEGVPGALPDGGDERVVDGRVYNVQVPTLTHHAPTGERRTGTAVIVCPGGGYARLAVAKEGAGVTGRLVPLGIDVFVLKYRLAEYGYPAPLQDVLRAVRLVRSRAKDLGVRPDRIGVFGASAGGHLAAMAATLYDTADGRTGAALDGVSPRPDFVALLYPVVTMRDPYAHAGSRRNLLGEHPPEALLSRLSIERQVTAATPPVFLVHTAEDQSVPLENSLLLLAALRKAGVPVEFHAYERGTHGFGVQGDLGTTSGWVDRWTEWMRAHGWI